MSKSKQSEIAKQQKELRRAERERAEAKRAKKEKKILIISAVSFLLVIAVILTMFIIRNNKEKNGDYLREEKIFSNGENVITGTMFRYLVYEKFADFCEENGDVSYYGIDKEKPLFTQTKEDGDTWAIYFENMTMSDCSDYIILAEEARKRGISLTDEEMSVVDNAVKETDLEKVGGGVNENDVKEAIVLRTVAEKCKKSIKDGFEYDDKRYEEEYEKRKASLDVIDSISYSIEHTGDIDAKKASELADKIIAEDISTKEKMASVLETVLKDYGLSDFENNINVLENGSYESLSDVAKKWLESAKEGDKGKFTGDTRTDVVVLKKCPHREENWKEKLKELIIEDDYIEWIASHNESIEIMNSNRIYELIKI